MEDVLIVIVPGLNGRRKNWDYLFDTIDEAVRGDHSADLGAAGNAAKPRISSSEISGLLADLRDKKLHRLFFDYPRHIFSLKKGRDLSIRLNGLIHQKWIENGGYSRIILIGHSFGGLLARQAYLYGLGKDKTVSEKLPWIENVQRIALLASINRGLDPDSSLLVRLFSHLVPLFRPFERTMLADALRGSDFLSNLRIEWLRQFNHEVQDPPSPADCEIVQLLGDEDSLVKREDSLDVEKYRLGYTLTVPDARHGDIHNLRRSPDPNGRLSLLIMAFFGSLDRVAENRDLRKQAERTAEVYFLLHGIRATNSDWPDELEETIRKRRPDGHTMDIRTPSYGYMSALRFAVPYFRRRYLSWFKDTYTQCLAEYASVDFHFIGHSNGTYLFGHSVAALPGMSFKRAALIGSVLPSEFDWSGPLNRGQIESLRNERARDDVPVGYLCSGLRGLRMKDVGTGGTEGFYQALPQKAELYWYRGGHGAVFEDSNATESLAAYILGEIKQNEYLRPPANKNDENKPSRAFRLMSRFARYQFQALGAALFFWVLYMLSLFFGWNFPSVSDLLSWIQADHDRLMLAYNGFGAGVVMLVLEIV